MAMHCAPSREFAPLRHTWQRRGPENKKGGLEIQVAF